MLRLLSAVKSMRLVVNALGKAIPGIMSIGGLLVMIVYMFAVSSTTLFREVRPDVFGDLWTSTMTLFRLMLADGWPDVVAPMAANESWVGAYFIVFTIVTTFVALNLFVAVTVEAMSRRNDTDEAADLTGGHGALSDDPLVRAEQETLQEVRALRELIVTLEGKLEQRANGATGL